MRSIGAAQLSIRDLHVRFRTYHGFVYALNGVNLSLPTGSIVGLVGESGSGKSITASSVVQLLPRNAEITRGVVEFEGADLVAMSEDALRRVRGARIGLVYQDARSALNPVFTVGQQFAAALRAHRALGSREAKEATIEALKSVRIDEPLRRLRQYPHELSGGMVQRVLVAMALMNSPALLILDEPTTGLDVTVQAEILDLIKNLVRSRRVTALLITHDLGIVAETCDWIAVMYSGRIVERGTAKQVLQQPRHPYTQGLLEATLSVESERSTEWYSIPGVVSDLHDPPAGCVFKERCPRRAEVCETVPDIVTVGRDHIAKCHFAQ